MQFIKCALCGSNQTFNLFVSKDFIYGLPGKFKLVRCEKCGLVYINPQPTREEIDLFYPPEYAAHQNSKDFMEKGSNWKRKMKKYLRLRQEPFSKIKGAPPRHPQRGKILDIGCGSGQFLKRLKNSGWQCYGVELSPLASQKARGLGLNILTGDLLSALYPADFFDVIVLNHTFEHLPHPNAVLKEIHRILKTDGLLQIYLPNIQSLAAKTFQSYWFNLDLPRHLYHYAPATLKLILRKHGFAIQKMKYGSSTAGILGSFQNWLKEKKRWRKNFRKNKLLCLTIKPLVKLIDLLRMGDSFYIYALK
ncbi:MAG: class I SAM-dependent methyltransferase [Patescibacteria group bacterium]|nr:class I SAM-dependent methyltransferase [Patescibacteria group bacterium]